MAFNDLSIQRKIRESDIAEFEKLFHGFYETLCRQAFSIIKDMDLAEDIVQEFFYNFWKNRETFTLKISLSSYMIRSVRNNALHYLRHMAVKQQYEGEVKALDERILGSEPAEIQSRELDLLITKALSEMPERVSRIFTMNRFEGMKYREIAETLKISIKTVEADMGKALQIFRKTLSDYLPGNTG